jgi:hypothetical protein
MTEEISPNIKWNSWLEEYFASTGEKAHCLSWCHKKAETIYSQRRTFVEIPVIVGSAVIGFLNAGSSSMFSDAKISSILLGIGSLSVGVLQTVNTYFSWAKRAESHRIAAIQYSKLYRFLNIEMSLPREERMSPHDLLKHTKDAYDRLQEISPLIPPEIVKEFKITFQKETEISKPEETNGLEKITIYNPMIKSSKSSGDKLPDLSKASRPSSSEFDGQSPSASSPLGFHLPPSSS